jgi:glyoxylase-like metal-dependent hydrolase (beta-lactamase superfamily II)
MSFNMEIYKIETGNLMIDGGAMFGVVPKSLWEEKYPANEKNLCNLSMRSLLIVTEGRKILIDTGVGNKQDEKFFGYYYLNGNHSLKGSLKQTGSTPDDITDVILTHLHFDHCGGAVEYNENNELKPAFKNARYWISSQQWEWANNPNHREKASFLKENFIPIKESGQLEIIDSDFELVPGIELRLYDGHTEGQIIPFIRYNNKTIVYVADLIPTSAHIPLSWICGFDAKPLVSLEEKKEFLEKALEKGYTLFFEHDINVECCSLKMTEKGIRVGNIYKLEDFLSN